MRLLLILFIIASILSAAENDIPEAGLKAEMQGEWTSAVQVYEEIVTSDPTRIDLFLRLSDIYSKLNDYSRANESLQKAIEHNPNNAALYAKQSQILAVNRQPNAALSAIKKAVALEPDNIQYLRSQATIANWNNDYDLAVQSYKTIYAINKDHQVLMQIALSNSWSGHLDIAAKSFEEYLAIHPEEKNAYVHYARTEIWRGNYPQAEKILDTYVKKFGGNDEIRKIRADLYARAEWPDASHELYTPLIDKEPNDYMLNYTRTLALFHDQKPLEAIESLKKVESLQPQSKDSMDLRKFILTKYRSNIEGSGFYSKDNDDIEHTILSLYGHYYINPKTSIFAGTEYDRLRTRPSSTYINIDGSRSSSVTRGGIGVSHRANENLGFDLLLGQEDADYDSTILVRANARIDINDKSTLFLNASHGFYMISPRSVSLGVKRLHSSALLELRPNLSDTVLLQGEYDLFSQNNTRWSGMIAPRHAVVRRESWSMDLGVKAWLFGYDKNLNQGYYDPKLFESYMGTAYLNYRFSQDNELFMMAGFGIIKDDTLGSYRPGGNIDLIGTIGIYQDWQLQARTGYMNNQRDVWNDDFYDIYYVGLSILRRF